MTHFLQRTAILLMTACALCAQPALARTHHHHHVAKKGPAAHRASAADSEGTVITLESGSASYVVKKGDTLGKIADQLDTTVADLKRDNKLKSNALQPGQVLKGGSKSKPIRLGDGDHEISCKVDGIAVGLKACFVKKA